MSRNQAVGAYGERLAERWYVQRGYRCVARNWRCPHGEIDRVVSRGDLLVIVEVKTRTSDRFGSGALAVGKVKQLHLRRAASQYLRLAGGQFHHVRFDVAVVEIQKTARVTVIEAAF